MAVLANSKHEHFALAVAKGVNATKAYASAGYSARGAQQSSARMLRNAVVCSRITELQAQLSAGLIAREITDRNARVGILQDLVDRMRKVIDERGTDMADVPGGSTGLLVRANKGKNADTSVYRFDATLVEQLCATCKQMAIEVGQWSEKREIAGKFDLGERLRAARRRKAEREARVVTPASDEFAVNAEPAELMNFGR